MRGPWSDWLTYPVLVAATVAATGWSLGRLDGVLVTTLVTAGLVVVLFGLERARPARAAFRVLDQPLSNELGHFLLGAELGTVIGVAAAVAIGTALAGPLHRAIGVALWPTAWPAAAQVVVALVVSDAAGYLQHRAYHAVPALWRIHALHHQSERMSVVKTGRFHALDFGAGTLVAYVPLIVAGAPAPMLVWVATMTSVLGVLQHANVRLPTPRWLDAIVCTPASHWRHHGRGDTGNYATIFTAIDHAIGSAAPPGVPDVIGSGEPSPPGLVAQLLAPFRRRR